MILCHWANPFCVVGGARYGARGAMAVLHALLFAAVAASERCCCYMSSAHPCVCVPNPVKSSCNELCDSEPAFSGPCGSCDPPCDSLHNDDGFTGAQKFERWSHFQTYGVPGTVGDALNRAAIADGTCRMHNSFGGYALWANVTRVNAVISALSDKTAPRPDKPSHFVHAMGDILGKVCPSGEDVGSAFANFSLALPLPKLASALDSWYRALCAPEGDPSWKGVFDPADQPQQIALTAGFMCAVTCDLHNEPLSSEAMKLLKLLGQASTCAGALPWGHGKPAVVFSAAKTHEELAKMLQPLREDHEGGSLPATCAC